MDWYCQWIEPLARDGIWFDDDKEHKDNDDDDNRTWQQRHDKDGFWWRKTTPNITSLSNINETLWSVLGKWTYIFLDLMLWVLEVWHLNNSDWLIKISVICSQSSWILSLMSGWVCYWEEAREGYLYHPFIRNYLVIPLHQSSWAVIKCISTTPVGTEGGCMDCVEVAVPYMLLSHLTLGIPYISSASTRFGNTHTHNPTIHPCKKY